MKTLSHLFAWHWLAWWAWCDCMGLPYGRPSEVLFSW